jgi:hypothetical protein
MKAGGFTTCNTWQAWNMLHAISVSPGKEKLSQKIITLNSCTFHKPCHLDKSCPIVCNWLCPIIVIIVHYPNTWNVFQVFRSHKQHQHSESINIILHKICAWFWLILGFSKAYCHHSRDLGYTEPISLTEVEVGETMPGRGVLSNIVPDG